ncbi:MAG: hypothetical protein H7Z75_12535 [Ferruginibacter sp.]|nr:hypothetical protein [Cytophagales bacterium]
MKNSGDFLLFLTMIFATIFLIGIIRPDFVVFWSSVKSRGKAAVFGGLAVVCFVIWGITASQREDTFKNDAAPRDSSFSNQSR